MARPKNPNTPPKKEATGRKYFVVDAAKYREFIESLEVTPLESKSAALDYADSLATAADDAEPGVKHEYAIFEEAGFLATEVVKKVNRGFATSRTINRAAKAEAAPETTEAAPETTESASQESGVTEESTTEEAPRRGSRKNRGE